MGFACWTQCHLSPLGVSEKMLLKSRFLHYSSVSSNSPSQNKIRWAESRHCHAGGKSEAEGDAPTHLVQHGVALRPLPLPQENQPRDDVGRDDVEVSEELSEQVGDLRVGVLQKPSERKESGCGEPQNRPWNENQRGSNGLISGACSLKHP